MFMFVGTALSLGSWWGLFAFLLMMPAFIWRILEEEGFLLKNLPGYAEYENSRHCSTQRSGVKDIRQQPKMRAPFGIPIRREAIQESG